MVVIDTVIRLIPGVLGDPQSAADESHSEEGRLEYPQYTRPRVFRGMEVPEVLLSGNHQAVARWREEQSRARSRRDEDNVRKEREGGWHEERAVEGGDGQTDRGRPDLQGDGRQGRADGQP